MFQNCQALDASIVTALRQFLSSVPPGVWRFAWRLALSTRGILSAPGSKETMWRFRSMAYTVSSQEVNSPPWPTLNSTFSKTWGSRRATRVRRQLSRTCHGEGCGAKFMVHQRKYIPASAYYSLIVSPAEQDVGQRWSEWFFRNNDTVQCPVQRLWKRKAEPFVIAQVECKLMDLFWIPQWFHSVKLGMYAT